MKFNISSEIITPLHPVLQGGFASRYKHSEGVHDDLYASVTIIENKKLAIILTFDLVYGDKSFSFSIKEALKRKFGIKSEEIIINFAHTHSGIAATGLEPSLRNNRSYSISGNSFRFYGESKDVDFTLDEAYYKRVENIVLNLVESGLNNMTTGNVYMYKSQSDFGISRRLPTKDGISFAPYDNDDVMDKDLFILEFVDEDKITKGIVYNYACHPTSIGPNNYLISADFVGEVRSQLKSKYTNAEVVFLQGCGADIKPRYASNGSGFKKCTFEEVKEGSSTLVDDIAKALSSTNKKELDIKIEAKECHIDLHTSTWNIDKFKKIYNDATEPQYRKDSAKVNIEYMEQGIENNVLPYYMNIIRLDKSTSIIALENEVVTAIGKNIKDSVDEDVITLGYSNSLCCYIPTSDIIKNGGYEGDNFMMARLSGPFHAETEDIIFANAVKLIRGI